MSALSFAPPFIMIIGLQEAKVFCNCIGGDLVRINEEADMVSLTYYLQVL
jgi:hypothetical protein